MRYNVTMIRHRVVVHGHVQGVFFRDTCQRQATARHVDGWVTNRADGSVEAVFEGASDAVHALTDWCREGPPSARVERIDVHQETPRGEQGFAVR
ncbi:MAG: acylphosphatase [Nocardioidaceae bacterium]